MRVFVQVILISCLFNTQTTEGQEDKKTAHLNFKEFTMVEYEQNQACLEQSGGTQYHDILTSECQPCESLENSHERYTLCPEYQLKKANTELEKADKELDKANKELEQADTELEKKLELMELETGKQVVISKTLASVAIFLAIVAIVANVAIVLPTAINAFVVRYNSRTLRSQDMKQYNIEESIKLLKRNGDPSTDETSFLIANEESSTEPHHIPKFDIRGWNDDDIRDLLQATQHSPTKIEEMVITLNPQLELVSDVVATFPHVTRKLVLVLDGGDDERQQRFCIRLMQEIINFDTSKLQTQELRVEVRYRFSTILLKLVLRRGEHPQFTKLDIRKWNDDEIRTLFQTIQHSSSKIKEMRIVMKPQLELVSDVVATFPHVTRKLVLVLDGEYDERQQRFCIRLMEEIINFDTSKLQTQELKVEVRFSTTTTTTTISNRPTKNLLEVVLRRGEPPQFIKLDICGWNDDEIRKLFQTIQHSPSKIEEMVIWMKPQLEYVSDVVATFPLLTRKLVLELRGGDDERQQRFCGKLTEEINNFDTSKLQTQELKVEVRDGNSTIFIEVVLRRGEPHQFIKKSPSTSCNLIQL